MTKNVLLMQLNGLAISSYHGLLKVKLKRNLRLEKVVASKQLRLAVETEEERRTRLENDVAFPKSWQLCLSFKLDVLTT